MLNQVTDEEATLPPPKPSDGPTGYRPTRRGRGGALGSCLRKTKVDDAVHREPSAQ